MVQPAAAALLQPDLEYRLRYVIQEAWKLALQCKRQTLLPIDIQTAYATLQTARGSRGRRGEWVRAARAAVY